MVSSFASASGLRQAPSTIPSLVLEDNRLFTMLGTQGLGLDLRCNKRVAGSGKWKISEVFPSPLAHVHHRTGELKICMKDHLNARTSRCYEPKELQFACRTKDMALGSADCNSHWAVQQAQQTAMLSEATKFTASHDLAARARFCP